MPRRTKLETFKLSLGCAFKMPGKRRPSRPHSHRVEAPRSFKGPTELLGDCLHNTPELQGDIGPPPTELQGDTATSPQIFEIDTTQATAGSSLSGQSLENSQSLEVGSPSTCAVGSPLFEKSDEYPLFTPLLESLEESSFITRDTFLDPEGLQLGERRDIQPRAVSSLYANQNSITRPSIAGPLVDADFEHDESVPQTPVSVCFAQVLTLTKVTPVLRRVGRQSRDRDARHSAVNNSKRLRRSTMYGSETFMNSLIASLQRPASSLDTIVDFPVESREVVEGKQDNIIPSMPLKSCLRKRHLSNPDSLSTRAPSTLQLAQPRRVSFEEQAKVVSGPRIIIEDFDSQERVQQRHRVAAHDKFFQELRKACLENTCRFIPKLSENVSERRCQLVSNPESVRFWAWLRESACINFASDKELPFRMMEKMFRLIWADVFVSLPKRNETLPQDAKIVSVRRLTRKLLDFFVVFERQPMGEDHAKLRRDLNRLVFAAYDLRELLVPTQDFQFSYYLPLCGPGSSRRMEFLGKRVNILETLGSTHRADSSADVLCMTLCGGIIRSARSKKVDGLRMPIHQNVVECQAVGVAWRPAEGEVLSPWANHITSDEAGNVAFEKAAALERDVAK